ncbi:hypothetical protein GINT2_001820 [Glugoides intestinalis]
MKTLEDAELRNKKVLLVVDYNTKDLNNHYKIEQTIPTIKNVLKRNPCVLFIITHMGRPKTCEEYSTIPVYEILKEELIHLKYLRIDLYLKESNISQDTVQTTDHLIYFGDNTRYYSDNELIKFYSLFDIIVNDAFGTIHRPITFNGYAGLLLEREVKALSTVNKFDLLIIGGAKVDEKIKVIKGFKGKVFLGGVFSYKSKEHQFKGRNQTGSVQNGSVQSNFIFPIDFKVIGNSGNLTVKVLEELEDTDKVIDIGEESIKILLKEIGKSRSILWNGPLGKFEDARANSTRLLVEGLVSSQAKVVAGGGETLTAIQKYSEVGKFHHVSTGGGAMLAFLGDCDLPGLKSIE